MSAGASRAAGMGQGEDGLCSWTKRPRVAAGSRSGGRMDSEVLWKMASCEAMGTASGTTPVGSAGLKLC